MKAIPFLLLSLWIAVSLPAQPAGPGAVPPPASSPGALPPPRTLPAFTASPRFNTNLLTNAALLRRLAALTNQGALSTNIPAFPAAVPANPVAATAPAVRPGIAATLSNLTSGAKAPAAVPGAAATVPGAAAPKVPAPTTTAPPKGFGAATLTPTTTGGVTNVVDEETIPPGMIQFNEADLGQVLDIYALITGRTVLRPAALPAVKITLHAQTKLTKSEGAQALEAVFALNQIAAIPVEEKFVKIVPSTQAPGAAGEPVDAKKIQKFGPLTTHIMHLKYADPAELVPILSEFAQLPKSVVAVKSSQVIVLRDYAENVRRMMEMIEQVDVAVPVLYEPVVIPIKYALATDIQTVLTGLSSGGGGMSIGGSGGGGGTMGGSGGSRGRLSSGGASFGSGSVGGVGGMQGQGAYGTGGMNTGLNTMGGVGGAASSSALGAARSSFAQRLGGIIRQSGAAGGGASGDIQVIGMAKIIADERANSLLVFAEKNDLAIITNIINKLDVVLAQVLIETLIMEVAVGDGLEYGISAKQIKASDIGPMTGGFGALNPTKLLDKTPFIPGGGTNATSALSDGLTYVARFGNDLDVTARAIANDSRANLISRPRILTSHAKEASIFIGETRPYITSYYGGGGGYGGYGGGYGGNYSQYQQLQIGIQLSILPFINSEGLVVMDIKQRIQGIKGSVSINGNDVPITSDKEATAYIAVRDRDTVILGGYINADSTKTHTGVPILKDIPILGVLFRSNKSTSDRTELIVLVRPTVLNTPEAAATTTAVERDVLPGIRTAEKEYEDQIAKELKAFQKSDKKKKNQAGKGY